MLIRDMHPVERPAAKMKSVGVEGMKDEELLAVMLGAKSLEQAGRVLTSWKNGRKLRACLRLEAAKELYRREFGDIGLDPVLDSPAKSVEHLAGIRKLKQEHFVAIYLNARNQKIHQETLFIGTLSSSLIHPREVFAPAIERRGAAVIVAHNHPSGDPSPSREDKDITQRFRRAGELLGIELVDHIVIAENGFYSFREHQWG